MQFRRAQTAIFLLPVVERCIADADLSADLINRHAQLRLFQSKCDLLFRKFALLHDMTPFNLMKNHVGNSTFKWGLFIWVRSFVLQGLGL